MMNRIKLSMGTGVLALLLGLSATADTLAVYPPTANIGHAEDVQRMVVVLTRDDGVTLDVTSEAKAAFSAEGFASWSDGKVLPVADGEGTLTFTYGEHTASATVAVTNAGAVLPRSFRNDVQPVLLRSGCNSGSCHGSARGKNGFRLSLFGFDPALDYLSLTRELRSRRINPAIPEESLMLTKPAGQVAHEGGTVMEPGDILYETLKRWIAEGVQDDAADVPELTGIEIMPEEAVLEGEGAAQRFMVLAQYSDGTDRDVTETAILATSDELTLGVDALGNATAGQKGEVYVMARYGTFAVVSQVIVIEKEKAFSWPEDAQPKNYVDEQIFAKLRKLRTQPAELSSDSVFVRRVYIDVLGVLPTIEETNAFLADEAPDKRAKLIDALLQRPEFSDVWAMKWAEVLQVREVPNVLDRKGMNRYNDWLRQAVISDTPMDQLVRELLTAEGGNFTNPAANYFMIETDPLKMAENVAQVFMGIQMQCAQCHNHPFERWTMDDYYSFSAFFSQVGKKGSSDPRENVIYNKGGGEVKNLRDGQVMAPTFLGGETPELAGRDRRAVLAEWLTAPENPWFAENIANRVWAHFFGGGIVDPPDDVRVTNPPSHPQLLKELGARLVEYDYDLRSMVRDICNSYTYQMSTRPRDPAVRDQRNFAIARVRRLTAEQMLDAVCTVTDTTVKFPNLPAGARAAQVANGSSGIYFLDVFGRPPRTSVCTCERSGTPTLAQSLHLINGNTIQEAIKKSGSLLDQMIAEEQPTGEIVDTLFIAAMSRNPTEEEKTTMTEYVDTAEDRRLALEDAFWSVLNSKEFIFNH